MEKEKIFIETFNNLNHSTKKVLLTLSKNITLEEKHGTQEAVNQFYNLVRFVIVDNGFNRNDVSRVLLLIDEKIELKDIKYFI